MKTLPRFAAATVAAFALAACDDSGTGPSAADEILNDDVAVLAADAVQEDLEVMNTLFPVGGVPGAPVAAAILEYSRSRTVDFYDADGALQEGYDALLTASIHTTLEVAGEMSRQGFEWSLDRARDMWVTGLEGEETERTWNGTGAEDRSRARILEDEVIRTYDLTGSLLVEDVVRGVPRAENPWPLSGTITRTLTIEVTNGPRGDETITRTVVVTFNGTRYPEMTVNGEVYQVDLAAEGRSKARRHGNG